MITINSNEYFPENYNIAKALASTDADMVFTSLRENFKRFLGAQSEHKCLYNLINKNDVLPLKAAISHISEKGYIYFVTQMSRIDGQKRQVSLKITLLPENNKNDNKYSIELLDLCNIHNYIYDLEFKVIKYKKILENFGRLFFEYNANTKIFNIFTLNAVCEEVLYSYNLDDLAKNIPNAEFSEQDKISFSLFCQSLNNNDTCFEYAFDTNPFETDAGKNTGTTIINGRSIGFDESMPITVGCINIYLKDQPQFEYISNINSLDMMTGLLNKKAVLDIAKSSIEEKKYKQLFFIMIDLDNFKMVNDNYGHMVGDEVIRKISAILKRDIERHGCIGRFGGDEFFAVLHDLGGEGDLRTVLGSISSSIENCYKDKFDGFNLSASIGVSEYPRNGSSFALLFKKADRAVYIAKKKGKKRYIIYKEALHGDIDLNSNNEDYVETLNTQKFAGDIKCFSLMRDGITQLLTEGISALDRFMKDIINAYCLTGISIYMGEDFSLYKQWGTYSTPMPNADYMKSKNGIRRFNQKNIFWENNVQSNGFYVPIIHDKLLSHNIYSTVQCMIGSPDNLKGIVTFDVEQILRNWTEEDTNYFGIVSQVVGNMLQ